MIILAIETSCDDTCCAIVQAKGGQSTQFKILSNVVSSQVKLHRKYGGVYPSLAKREHQRNLPIVLRKALKKAGFEISNFQFPISTQFPISNFQTFNKCQKPEIEAIAVTVGPGLEPCLWQGVNFAKGLACQWDLPIIPVNHIEAHIAANWLAPVGEKSKVKSQKSKIQVKSQNLFPAICLVISGGHTQLILMRKVGDYEILGETRDDAAGECFDKTARILGLGWPGGPAIAAVAAKLKVKSEKLKVKLPRPMLYSKDYDFSFSGLKTAVLYDFKKRTSKTKKSNNYRRSMAAEIQQAIIDVLIKKTIKAAQDYVARTIIIGGGVAANQELRNQFNYKLKTINHKINFLAPPKNFCTDNAAMAAVAGCFNFLAGEKFPWRNVKADANLRLG